MARILIADDDELVVEAVRAALEAHGHIVGGLEDGASVGMVVELKRPDLVILDCVMPTSGIKALRDIRTSPVGYTTPVLMLTARRGQADEDIAIGAGADGYLRKPFDPEHLVFRVEEMLEQRQRKSG